MSMKGQAMDTDELERRLNRRIDHAEGGIEGLKRRIEALEKELERLKRHIRNINHALVNGI